LDKALISYGPIIVIVIAFYFILIRPQQRRQKDRNTMLKALQPGAKVVTIGGIHGTVTEMDDQTVTLRVADNTRMTFERSAVNAVKGQ
jgi:preprotein translocase subunit YajC